MDNVFYIGSCCSHNVNMEQFNSYVQELDTLIQVNKRSYLVKMIAGDFNLKATAWEGRVNDRRRISLLNVFAKNGIVPINMNEDHHFVGTEGTVFLTLLVRIRD